MTDFYTVLCNALDRVGAVDFEERDRVYGHVRDVMLRKLRNHRPPLLEAEIESRLNTFDAAIDRIETELAEPSQRFVHQGGAQSRRERLEVAAEADEASADADWAEEEPPPEPVWGSPAIEMAWDETAEQWRDPPEDSHNRSRAVSEEDEWDTPGQWNEYGDETNEDREPAVRSWAADDTDRGARPAAYREPADDEDARSDRRSGREARGGLFARLAGLFARREPARRDERKRRPPAGRAQELDPIDELAGRLGSESRGARREPLLLSGPGRPEPRLFLPSPDSAGDEERPRSLPQSEVPTPVPSRAAPAPRRWDQFEEEDERPRRRRSRRRETPPRRERRRQAPPPEPTEEEAAFAEAPADRRSNQRRILRFALLAFAVIVFAWAAYVFVPILFPAEPEGTEPEPVETAEPVPAAEAGEQFVLFRGEDPTIFESGSDNPVEFVAGGEGGGYVQIGSTITSGGARAVIGPGLAEQLAGHEVRVIMEVRGSPSQPAATTRLGYQRGVAINDWKILRVPTDFGVISATWVVGPDAGNREDYLLIEPGVPGDGNSIDIRAIAIEIID